jgi:hypothetical protein
VPFNLRLAVGQLSLEIVIFKDRDSVLVFPNGNQLGIETWN